MGARHGKKRLHLITILINMWDMNPPRPSSASQAKACPDPVGVVRVTDLLKNRQVLVIEHAGERYLLRLTRNGKLILTK